LKVDWFDSASAWILNTLEARGIPPTGPVEQVQLRPWSVVLRAPTYEGDVYYKAAPASQGYEIALTARLAAWHPAMVPEVLGFDLAERCLLMRDGGAPIRERVKRAGNAAAWFEPLGQFANLQIELAERVMELLALGVPDRRPTALPSLYEALLQDAESTRVDRAEGLTSDELTRLRELAPQFAEWCARLAVLPVAPSLHHGDLNNGNVLFRDGDWAFTDWGDASVAHPFCSLRTVLVSNEIVLGLPDNDSQLAPLREAYLAAWGKRGTPETLHEIFRLAHRVSSICSALSWHHTLSELPPDARTAYLGHVPGLLKEFLYADVQRFPFD
jgi:hypothetical protein